MLLVPPATLGYQVQNDMIPAGSPVMGQALTASASTNTMGSWVSLLSTISYDIWTVVVIFSNSSGAGTPEQIFVDLGIGPDSDNVTVIADSLMAGCGATVNSLPQPRFYNAPLHIPAGTQLWGRCQSTVGSNTVDCAVWAYGGADRPGFPVIYAWESIGANAGTTLGTTITQGNGSFGTYAQMTASSANDYVGLLAAETATDGTFTAGVNIMKAGIGAATEQELGPLYWGYHDSSERIPSFTFPVYADIPAGTRIALSAAGAAAGDSGCSAIAYGLRAA